MDYIFLILVAYSFTVVSADTCFTDASLAGLLFGTCFATFLISFTIALVLWCFTRTRTLEKTEDVEGTTAESNNNNNNNNNEQNTKNSYDNEGLEIENKETKPMDILGINKLTPFVALNEHSVKQRNSVQDQCTQSPELLALHNQYTQFPDSYMLQNEYTQFPDPFVNVDDYFFQSMLKKITALGFNIQDENGNIFIGSVFPGSPAERSGNIFAGDKIKSLNICFEGMLLEDATAILGHASPYKVKLELERHLPENATVLDSNTSELSAESEDSEESVNGEEPSADLCNEASASDSTLPASSISTAIEPDVTGSSTLTNSSESLIIKQDPVNDSETISSGQQTVEEVQPTATPETPTTQEEVSQNMITSPSTPLETIGSPKIVPRSTLTRRPQPSRIPKLNPEAPLVVKEVKCDSISEFIEVSRYNYAEPSVLKKRSGNVEFCEWIEPKRKSVVVEFKENEPCDNIDECKEEQTSSSAEKPPSALMSPPKIEELRVEKTKNALSPASTPIIHRKLPAIPKPKTGLDKPEINASEIYTQQKDGLRKVYSPQMRQNNNRDKVSLAEKRRARLEANETLLQKQQEELRALGIIP